MSVLNPAEKALLDAAPRQFPMIAAASAALKRCGTCGHKSVNIRSILVTIATRYCHNDDFKAFLRTITKLPVVIGGILIE